ncbi:1-phosphatidylinositol 4,5-bisphosphate phosphodiesterase [Gryllus bimaculatus]|nr:1-phosphatidylinositol 4,5-bisphosphate phosphodiesterase [Gryllus bimaculatus]
MTRDGFFRYLTSDEATPVALDRLDVYMDMTQPLAHYFINSSHNTYLVGRQFAGSSSVEMYRQPIVTHGHAVCSDILLRDVLYAIADTAFVASEWPVVLSIENHCTRPQQQRMAQLMEEALGPLLLREPLPEFPCGVWSGVASQLKAGVELPSPWALRRKVLVKNKRLKPDEERAQLELFRQGQLVIEDDDDDQDDPQVPGECAGLGNSDSPKSAFEGDEGVRPASPVTLPPCDAPRATPSAPEEPPRPQEQEGAEEGSAARPPTALSLQLSSSSSSTSAPSGAKGSFAATPEEDDAPLPYVHVTSTSKVHPWLSSLVNYVEPVKFPGFTAAQQRDMHYHMSSFAETNGQSLVNKFGRELINYNKRQMTRIYPKGVRVDSSNFIPQVRNSVQPGTLTECTAPKRRHSTDDGRFSVFNLQIFWNGGCQMVSLNFQTPDLPMQLNQGKFEPNGNAGYVLKPDIMRRADRDFDPFTEAPVDGVIAGQCSVQVISGQFLCERPATTYVEVDMYGLPIDTIRREFRTRAVPNNGLNPVYNEEPFLFRLVVLPDLALLRVSAMEEGGRLLGQRVLPLDGLQPGYRHIPLRSEANQPLPLAQLFCYIEIKIYVPAGYEDIIWNVVSPRTILYVCVNRVLADLTAALLDPRGHRLAREAAAAGGGEGAEAEAGDARLKKGEEPWPFVSVEMAPLRALPAFRRLAQRHCTEVRSLRARHHKQLLREGRRQSEEIEKMAARKDPVSLVADSEIRPLVRAQAGAWSELRARHVRAEWELVKRQLAAQEALLLRLQEEAHHRQRKELKRMHDRQKRELTAQQAKAVEAGGAGAGTGAGVGAFGRHSRTDRKRRMRERMRSNTNLFLREMRMLMARQDKTMERLTAQHAQARDALFKEMQRIYELYNNEELEYSLQPKIENYV